MGISDLELVDAIRKGEIIAFQELYKRYADLMYRNILVRVNSSFDADDIFQDFFIKLWEKRANFKIESNVKVYLLVALKHHILNTIKERQIRLKYQESFILFVTSYLKYSLKGYEYGIFRYIMKERVQDELPPALEEMQKKIEGRNQRFYTIESQSVLARLAYEDILYLDVSGKYVYFHTRQGEIRERASLQKVFSALGAKEFVYTDKSHIVNLKHVMQLEGNTVVMRNQERIPVSIPQGQKIKKAISDYWRSLC